MFAYYSIIIIKKQKLSKKKTGLSKVSLLTVDINSLSTSLLFIRESRTHSVPRENNCCLERMFRGKASCGLPCLCVCVCKRRLDLYLKHRHI